MNFEPDIQDAEIAPTTVGQYVRGKFGYWAKRYVGIITLIAPIATATQARAHGDLAGWIAPALAAWALACALSLLVILMALAVGGWWQLRRSN